MREKHKYRSDWSLSYSFKQEFYVDFLLSNAYREKFVEAWWVTKFGHTGEYMPKLVKDFHQDCLNQSASPCSSLFLPQDFYQYAFNF